MSAFSYAALDDRGKQLRGVLEADSSRQVRQMLRDKGWVPLSVEAASNGAVRSSSGGGWSLRRGLNTANLALITRQLATLVQSSMPLEEALTAVAAQAENNRIRSIMLGVRGRVLEGHSLAHALQDYPQAFPQMYRAMISAGEQSGHLDAVLERLADYTETSQDSGQQVKLALLYPVILLLVAMLIVIGLMTFVVPQVVGVFVDQGQQLPWLTQRLIGLSAFLKNYSWLVIGVVVLLVWGVRVALRKPHARLAFDRRIAHLPLARKFSRANNTVQFSSTLSILVRSGVPLVDALHIAREVVPNHWLRERLIGATQSVSEGSSLKDSLESCQFFSPLLIHMVGSGEASGALGKMLTRAADNEQRSLDNIINTGLKLFEPLVLLMMGGIVFLIVLAILQPIFELNQLV
ncbi:MAG: type II secretion system inner membrane protein GspF [Pseudomonadales bacterium]